VRVVYFGTYERGYPRNAQVISCLRRAGVEVLERHESVWEGTRHKWALGGHAALRVLAAEARLARGGRLRGVDAVIVGYPGQLDMPVARVLSDRVPLVFNPLVSLSETLVGDRGRYRARSPAAAALRALDRLAFRSADVIVADTAENASFLAELAGVGPERLEVCFVGAEERLFQPLWERREPFHVLFVGKLIPLHGVETILEAARLAPGIPFRIVGGGQLESVLENAPANVERVPWVEYEQLPHELAGAGCALGIFGTGAKAHRVIPNKAFQAIACGTPLVTADTRAARELLVDEESALLVPAGDAEALASAVQRLAEDESLARRIGGGGRTAYEARASEAVLGPRWQRLVERVARRT
jgi:glycosyltransferase involved in cell wall biosynthesis